MADPVSAMAMVGMGSTAIGGVTSAIGGSYSAGAKANMYMYQAGVADINAQIARENANYSRQVGEVEAEKTGMQQGYVRGVARATQSGRGVDIGGGSAKETIDSQTRVNQYDQQIIRSNAARRAYGYEIEGAKYDAEGKMYKMAAEQTKKASTLSTIGSLLGTAGSVASKWIQWGQVWSTGGQPAYAEDNKWE